MTLLKQRQALRQELFVQRQLIAQQLDSTPEVNGYPRSMTMRFLTGKLALGSSLAMNATTLLGMSVVKSLAASLFMAEAVKRNSG